MTYALDTNIISYYIQQNMRVRTRFRAALADGGAIVIPPAAYYEILRGFRHVAAPKKEAAFYRMCDAYSIGEMNSAAWECAARLYGDGLRAGRKMGDGDAMIAAFCIVSGYILVTHNVKHFKAVDGLMVEDWAE